MPNCSEEGNDQSFNPTSDRGNANVSDACPAVSTAGAEFESPLRKYRSFDVYGSKFREDSSHCRETNSVQSEPANFYSSAVEAREFLDRSQPPSSVLAEYPFVSTGGDDGPDFNGRYTPHAPKCEDYEEISATVELSEEADDDDHLYGSYAETDLDNLDQTTDFSQKYKEHFDNYRNYGNSQLDETDNLESFPFPNEEGTLPFHQDTVKVYCTEGTPLFISTASSLTDLREIGESGGVNAQKLRRRSLREPKEGQIEESEGESFNSDAAAAEQNSGPAEKEQAGTSLRVPPVKEGKTVTFGEEISLADETPLMFSRSSSLGSLSSFEQQGMQDDRLAVGNFSQQTSGNVSPSDLPDSPSETMPPSPRRPSQHAAFHLPPCVRPLPLPVNCVFREVPRSFAEEGTPCRISQATSLSSLAVDDERCINEEVCAPQHSISGNVFNDVKHQFAEEGTPCRISRAESLSPLPLDDVDANDDGNASAALQRQFTSVNEITGGVQIKQQGSSCTRSLGRENLTVGNGHLHKIPPEVKQKRELQTSDTSNEIGSVGSCGHMQVANGHQRIQRGSELTEKFFEDSHTHIEERRLPNTYHRVANAGLSSADRKPSLLEAQTLVLGGTPSWIADGKDRKASVDPKHPIKHVTFSGGYPSLPPRPPAFADDSTRVYCTEDTPANLSHAASYSDLSSINGERSLHAFDEWGSDDNSSDILAECIQLGKSAAMRNGSAQKAEKDVANSRAGTSSSENMHLPPEFERNFVPVRLSSPARNMPSIDNGPQDVRPESGTILDGVRGNCFPNERTMSDNVEPLSSNFGSSMASTSNEKDAEFSYLSSTPSCSTDLADGDATVEQVEQHSKLDSIGSSKNTDSDTGRSSEKLELSDDDDVDDSEILAEVIRLGMPKSDGLCVGSPVRVSAIMPRAVQKKGSHQADPVELLDDEADDRRLLEEVINLGRQQLKMSLSSISKSVIEEGHSSRPRTKERRANFQPSKPRSKDVLLTNGSAPLQYNAQLYRARSSESQNGHAVRARKQNLIHYERSASEKRQNPLAFRQNDVGFTSDCEELYKGQNYGFTQATAVHRNNALHQKPFFAHCRPLRMAREARNHVQTCHEHCRKLGSTTVEPNECNPLSPSQQGKCKLPPKPPSRQPTQPMQFCDFDSDSENEVDDAKLLREVIMLGTSGLSNVSPKIPVLRKQMKPSNGAAAADTATCNVTNQESSSTDDEALLQEVIWLGKSKALAASKTSSTAPRCSLSETKSLRLKADSASGDVVDGSEISETLGKVEAGLSATVPKTNAPVVPEFSQSSMVKQMDVCDAESVTKQTEGLIETDNLVGTGPLQKQSSASSYTSEQLKEKKLPPGIASALPAVAKSQAPARDGGASAETSVGREKEQLDMPPEPPADSPERITAIRIKLPDGRALTRRFMAAWELRVLLTFLNYLGYPVEKFKIIKNWRRQELSISNPQQTLEQLKLYPKKTLTIKER